MFSRYTRRCVMSCLEHLLKLDLFSSLASFGFSECSVDSTEVVLLSMEVVLVYMEVVLVSMEVVLVSSKIKNQMLVSMEVVLVSSKIKNQISTLNILASR